MTLHVQIQPPVPGEQVEHVVEEAHARLARARAGAVQPRRQTHVSLAGLALDRGGATFRGGHHSKRESNRRHARLHRLGVHLESLGAGDRRARRRELAPRLQRRSAPPTSAGESAAASSPEAKRAAPPVGSTWLEPAT